MRKISDGKVVIDVDLDDKGINKGIKNIDNKVGKLGETVGKATQKLKSMAGVAVKSMLAGATAFAGYGIKMAADMAVVEAQFSQTFKGMEEQGGKMLEALSSDFNILPERLKPAMTSFQGYFKGAGMEAEEALGSTNKAMKIAADGAAFFDKSLEDTSGSLKSFLMGNFEAGDALGINTNATKIAAAYNKKYGGTFQEISDAQQQNFLLEYVEGVYALNGAMGQGQREAEEWGNVTGNLISAFGTLAGIVMQPLLEPLNVGMQILTDKMLEGTEKVKEFYSSLSENSALTQFTEAVKAAFDGDFSSLIDIGKSLLKNIIIGFNETIPELRLKFLEMTTNMVLSLQESMPLLIAAGAGIISSLIAGTIEGIPVFLITFTNLILSILTLFIENIPNLLEAGRNILLTLLQGIVENLPSLTLVVLTIITTFFTLITEKLPGILQKGVEILLSLVDGIIAALPEVGNAALRIFSLLLTKIIENLPFIIQKGKDILVSLVKGISERLPEIATVVVNIIGKFLQTIIENLPEIISAGIDIILSLIDGFFEMTSDLGAAIEEIADIVIDAISDIDLSDIGGNVIRGLWDGMVSVKDWLKKKVDGFVGSVVGWFTGGFDINSPSRVMEKQVGVYLPQGIGEGVEKGKAKLKDTINSVIGYGVNGIKIPKVFLDEEMFGVNKKNTQEKLDWASPMVKRTKKTKAAAKRFSFLLDLLQKEGSYDLDFKLL